MKRTAIRIMAVLCGAVAARAETPPVPPPTPPAAAPAPDRGPAGFDERLRRQEQLIERLLEENRALREQNQAIVERLDRQSAPASDSGDGGGGGPDEDTSDEGDAGARDNPAEMGGGGGDSEDQEPQDDYSEEGGAGARDNVAQPRLAIPPKDRKFPLKSNFGPGFEYQTDDGEFQLQFHNETQVEYRGFNNTGQGSVNNGFFIPRQIWYFTGRITKPIEFYTSIQKGLGDVNLRDAFLNFHYDDRLMFKVGRYKPPFLYEFYAISNQDLPTPERSLFALNFGDNREIGAMGWGELFDERLDYAVGLFNGPRNSFEDFNDSQNVTAYLNARPFAKSERLPFLKHLNLGGSVDAGEQDNPLNPQALRTAVNASNSSGSSTAAPAFLVFNDDIIESGQRTFWNMHMAYFYKGLTVMAEWDSGYSTYAPAASTWRETRVPVSGYYVGASYFLTGETITRRTQVHVKRPFDLRKGHFGLGAWEAQARYADLRLGSEVFTNGIADRALWSREASALDVGLNWYLNSYVKIYFVWEHADFGRPVFYGPGDFHRTSELYWLRFQLYF